jgi:uncharacterized protein with HEPN domain
MPKRNRLVRLRHMLDHAREALHLAQGRNRDELDSDRLLNLALVRLLEVVGEAANRVPKEEQSFLLESAFHPTGAGVGGSSRNPWRSFSTQS